MDMNFEWHTRDEKLLVVAYWWDQQGGKCCFCGGEMEPYHRDATKNPRRATVEHVIPRRENGPNTAGNARLAHASCNNSLGSLWEINRRRKEDGLPPLSERWVLNNARGREAARQRDEVVPPLEKAKRCAQAVKEKQDRQKRGVKHCAANAVSLPRGVTLLPAFNDPTKRAPKAQKMSAIETARWLMQHGIRGA